MADDTRDHEARLRTTEGIVAEQGWRLVGVERAVEKLAERVEENTEWRRDLQRRASAERHALSQREKRLGVLLVLLGPVLATVAAHFLR